MLGDRHRRVLLVPARGARAAQGAHASATGSPTPGYTFLENKYYLDHLYEDVIVGGIKGPIARASYWFNQHVIDGVVNGAGRGAAARRPRSPTTSSTRSVVDGAVNGIGRETGEAGGAAAQRPVRPRAAVRAPPVRRGRAPRPRPAHRERRSSGGDRLAHGLVRRLGTDPGGLPARRRAWRSCCCIPQAAGAGDQGRSRSLTTLVDRSASASAILADFDYDARGELQFQVERAVDRRHQQPLPPRRRRHLAAAAGPVDAHHRVCASSTRGTTSPSRTTRRRSSR